MRTLGVAIKTDNKIRETKVRKSKKERQKSCYRDQKADGNAKKAIQKRRIRPLNIPVDEMIVLASEVDKF